MRPQFDQNEFLHFRIDKSALDENNKIRLDAIKPPNQSVNRSWRGDPTDCLYPTTIGIPIYKYRNWGISRMAYARIERNFLVVVPVGKDTFKETRWCILVVHDPEPNLYSHCEIRIHESGKDYDQTLKPNNTTKLSFRRSMMLAHDKVIKFPSN